MAGVSHHMATSQDTSVDRIGIFVSIASVKCSAALSQSKVGVLTKRKKKHTETGRYDIITRSFISLS